MKRYVNLFFGYLECFISYMAALLFYSWKNQIVKMQESYLCFHNKTNFAKTMELLFAQQFYGNFVDVS